MDGYVSCGFVLLRTPLLPVEELLALHPRRVAGASPADEDLARERDDVARALARIAARPEVREAVFLASPALADALGDGSALTPKAARSLYRYFVRMSARPTPFGLFAGVTTGTTGPGPTRLELVPRSAYRRVTRLDMSYLYALARAVAARPQVRESLRYAPNSTSARLGDRLHFVETRLADGRRTSHVVAAEIDDDLDLVLTRSAGGARCGDLVEALCASGCDEPDAWEYVGALIDSQILVPDLLPGVTGPEPMDGLLTALRDIPAAADAANGLAATRQALHEIDAGSVGSTPPSAYLAAEAPLAALPAEIVHENLFKTDLLKPAAAVHLAPPVLAAFGEAAELLARVTPRRESEYLSRVRRAFEERYEGREVPLVEALDEEHGLASGPLASPAAAEPLLRALPPDPSREAPGEVQPRDAVLLRKLTEALRAGSIEATLDAADVEELTLPPQEREPLPDVLHLCATIAAASAEAADRGDFRLVVKGAAGPGALFLGRFCHQDPAVLRAVEHLLRAEEALHPGVVFAEIAHLPADDRAGNVLARPTLREHEIVYGARSSVSPDRRIDVSDLLLCLRDGNFRLRSRRLGREVRPRLTSAHNPSVAGNLPLYRFLAAMDGTRTLSFQFGALDAVAPFLPRVVAGRFVFARARWRLGKREIDSWTRLGGTPLQRTVTQWRSETLCPRHVALADYDNELPIDLECPFALETLLRLLRDRAAAVLVEVLPSFDDLCVRGPEGRYVHEAVVPFVRSRAGAAPEPIGTLAPESSAHAAARLFPPGSAWTFVKLYAGPSTCDRLLRESMAPLVEEARRHGAESWFFIRYADPDWHLRVRFLGEVNGLVEAAAARLLEAGLVHRVVLDTYDREVERYGGPEAIDAAEAVFEADSDAVLEILAALPEGDAGNDARWLLCLRGMDGLLRGLRFDLAAKRSLLRRLSRRPADDPQRAAREALFRRERRRIEEVLGSAGGEGPIAECVRALDRRDARLAGPAAALRDLEVRGRLAVPIADLAASLLHMNANRLLRAAHRAQEPVLYDFLNRLAIAEEARAR